MLRRLTGAFALLAILSTPSVAESRLVCRYTGAVVAGCAEEQVPLKALVQDGGCCERRAVAKPGTVASLDRQRQPLTAVVQVAVPLAQDLVGPRCAASQPVAGAPRAIGPPIFLRTRALLI